MNATLIEMTKGSAAPVARKTVLVDGDVTIDWNLARTRFQPSPTLSWSPDESVRTYCQPGGAALLGDLVAAIAADLTARDGVPIAVGRAKLPPRDSIRPCDPRFNHSFATWALFSYAAEKGTGRQPPVWRVKELLGYSQCGPTSQVPSDLGLAPLADKPPAVLVLDDAGLGFRDRPEGWPRGIGNDEAGPDWIVLKMARPIAQGPLWEHLLAHRAQRLMVVMTLDDLRLTAVRISRELSWERVAQDLAWELVHNDQIRDLACCAAVVVSLGPAGAFLLRGPAQQRDDLPPFELFFDPSVVEGMWQQGYPGRMIGYTTCLTGALVREVVVAPEKPDLGLAIRSGLGAMRTLHQLGSGTPGAPPEEPELAFPMTAIVERLAADDPTFVSTPVEDPSANLTRPASPSPSVPAAGSWTILQEQYPGDQAELAEKIVLLGPEAALRGVPLGMFGKLLTVDRREIESLRSVRALVAEYWAHPVKSRPLSIAVFGPPGAGKSFGIAQMAESILPKQTKKVTFNLAQLTGSDDLIDAFHQVRDVSLGGLLPLVFWDEFDTRLEAQELGWLRYFLAPMQDGEFQQGQITHPIGPAIFVFAGGTRSTMEQFAADVERDELRAAKGTDFVSRLKGFVNVIGPNPVGGDPATDPHYLIRRAILLRSFLSGSEPQLFGDGDGKGRLRIDEGVLRAFLRTIKYRHGARSMESIIAMSRLSGHRQFERSSLPPEPQLDLHVVALDFMRWVHAFEAEGERLERLAEAVHVVYCADELAKGYAWADATDEYLEQNALLRRYAGRPPVADAGKRTTTNVNLVCYEPLSEHVKEQNRGFVRDIERKLDSAGYVMLPARSHEPPFNFPGDELETLAEEEHERYVLEKLGAGWRHASTLKDETRKENPSILPWRPTTPEQLVERYGAEPASRIGDGVLSDEDKEKDRNLIRGIPRILAAAGYTVVKLPNEKQ